MKKTTYVFFVIVPLFLYYLYTLKSNVDETTSDKNYYSFSSPRFFFMFASKIVWERSSLEGQI